MREREETAAKAGAKTGENAGAQPNPFPCGLSAGLPAEPVDTGHRVSIVLVEDDDGHATLVERNLRRSGVSNGFLRFRDGQEALDYFFGTPGADTLAASNYPSREELANFVVLLDLRMPRVDGFEVLRRLKADPVTASVPVIVLTTTDDPREIERCYELGCNVYITKPVEYDAFIEAVRRLGFFLQVVKLPPGHRFVRP
ncbi:response regulator [Paraburkholderia pallida]|uniref:Response regulator n=1 Tax=Paraburkholderia pallida TaxID=2547399 RepID=A0A4P7CTG1_9BURK|nr:response regulator [Paraburkholderia pallida]QBQ97514.1 response regulator [Paraburkholderia pallida]